MIRARVTTTCLSRRPAIFLPRPTLDQAGKRFCEIGTKHFVEMSRGNKREIDRAKTQAKLAANQKATKVSWEFGGSMGVHFLYRAQRVLVHLFGCRVV
jgi:4F5 protein related disordered region